MIDNRTNVLIMIYFLV